MDKKKLYSDVRYDIHISCANCSVLFVNGNNPAKTTEAGFKSDYPHETSIFCGRFAASDHHGIWLLNSEMPQADEQKLIHLATDYQAFYEKKFAIPFRGSLSFVQTTPVADPRFWAFSFYSPPTH